MKVKPDFKQLKEEINLADYASSIGYTLDKKKSTKSSLVMAHEHNDKIIISKPRNVWIYFSVYDDRDNGTVIDFVKNRSQKSFYEIGRDLHGWLSNPLNLSIQNAPFLKKKSADPKRIRRLFRYCEPAINHAYLQSRSIPDALLRHPRFYGRIFQDQFRNAVFPHFKKGEVCGLELRGENINLFVRGSEKTLWRSNRLNSDDTLLIAETPIDAFSYQAIHGLSKGFYTATCGGFSPNQGEIIQKLVSGVSWIKEIILITDNDEGGDKITARLEQLILQTNYEGSMIRHSPQKRGCDWNDVLNQVGI